ncbi:DNA-binding transcriptional regulator, MarR family [Tardiphaga sp. OK246]|uniref:MarR family winged helix-turn-helix transcriptional regulator n=1 Tax=Tardiphaga sp. OK246 TaxID=1855307 RepID=UPI000B703CF4|nr:MarR family winged helix-turn-helix transcriptional regulator [Tardiphaga sp. OK246]SNT32291.1 DNA-binding transcriptional regulator, MarR family [Tardiphaga sp. OK246]
MTKPRRSIAKMEAEAVVSAERDLNIAPFAIGSFEAVMWIVGMDSQTNVSRSLEAERFCWDMITIDAHLAEIRAHLASKLKVSVPQWVLMSVLEDRDNGQGVSVRDVSKCMAVDASFVTTQSKMLEVKGLVRRVQSPTDARVILMSLSETALAGIKAIAGERELIRNFMFGQFDDEALQKFFESLAQVRDNISKASRLVSLYQPGG